MKKLLLLIGVGLLPLFAIGCTKQADIDNTTVDTATWSDISATTYDADSWKTIIPETCQNFYDGCNHCMRIGTWSEAGCTKMYCEIYSEPYCNDDAQPDEANANLDEQTVRDIYIWLSVDEATVEAAKRGVSFRLVEIDGVPQAVTMDYRPGRINATSQDGFITDLSIE